MTILQVLGLVQAAAIDCRNNLKATTNLLNIFPLVGSKVYPKNQLSGDSPPKWAKINADVGLLKVIRNPTQANTHAAWTASLFI